MDIWISAGRGIRYKEHPTRKHSQRPDRYWCIRYKRADRSVTEAVGWWSDGASKPKCEEILAELRRNWRNGSGPQSYKELLEDQKRQQESAAAEEESRRKADTTLAEFWGSHVRPEVELRFSKSDVKQADTRLRTWLGQLRDQPLAAVTAGDLERLVVKPMIEAGMNPNTIEAVLRLFSMIWHRAKALGFIEGDSPVATAKRPKRDGRRVRFLSTAEASELLAALWERSVDCHDFSLMSLFTGLRAGECSALTWPDINFDDGTIFVKDTKAGRNRHAYITAEVREMLTRRLAGRTDSPFVFYGRRGGLISMATGRPFAETVAAIGFNDGIDDDRQKVVFHTLRHTFASWLVQRGHPLYTVSQLMGHRLLKMTERYAHLAPDTLRAVSSRLDGFLQK